MQLLQQRQQMEKQSESKVPRGRWQARLYRKLGESRVPFESERATILFVITIARVLGALHSVCACAMPCR